jgi:N-acetylglutamate synthase-like GNAT family acetyltransferase
LVEFTVRPAIRDDAPAIRSLIHTVQINPTGLDWRRFLLAVTPVGSLLGCGQVKTHGKETLELASIAVQEKFRGQGVARAIIEALLARESHRPMYLMCRAILKPFYEKFRFHAIGLDEMPPYFQRISRAERIFNSKSKADDRLAVMCLD